MMIPNTVRLIVFSTILTSNILPECAPDPLFHLYDLNMNKKGQKSPPPPKKICDPFLAPADTVLMVFGDHGMTDSGDHGGDSNNGKCPKL